jgi:VanZ family protein
VAALGWTALLLGVHSIPKSDLEHIPGGNYIHSEGPDKLGHAFMFAILGVLWSRVAPHRPGMVVLSGIAYGVALEVFQDRLIQGRTGSISDVLADAVGLVIGVAAISALRRVFPREPAREQDACIGRPEEQ